MSLQHGKEWLMGVCVMNMVMCGCLGQQSENANCTISYPYVATAARHASILSGLPKVATGITADQVLRLIGEPDEDNPTYDSKDARTAKTKGHSFVYLLERKTNTGSVIERAERLIRIHFDLDNKVVRVDRVGF